MSPQRNMIITVGTSLFESATWANEGPLEEVEGYAGWLEPGTLESPAGRTGYRSFDGEVTGERISARLKTRIDGRNAVQWAEQVTPGFGQPMRYSAEIATLILRAREELKRELDPQNFREFLQANYSSINLVCSNDPADESQKAAFHLREYIYRLTGEEARPVFSVNVAPVITGSRLNEKVQSLFRYLLDLKSEEIEIVASGGYKIFAVSCAQLLPRHASWRLVYMHESSQEIVAAFSEGGTVDGRRFGDTRGFP